MTAFVVDTNVPIVANGNNAEVRPECVTNCIQALREVMGNVVCLDDGMRILYEYMRNLSMAGQPGAGDFFMKWVFDHQAMVERCEVVAITPDPNRLGSFLEFPQDEELDHFDLSDRKFVAVALASDNNPIVLNATDSDWWNRRVALERNGLVISFLCPEQFDE